MDQIKRTDIFKAFYFVIPTEFSASVYVLDYFSAQISTVGFFNFRSTCWVELMYTS
jgi:hypothetical protein